MATLSGLLFAYFSLAIVLDHAHLVCPLWLSWGSRDFRCMMRGRPVKFILLPTLCAVAAMLVGAVSGSIRDPAFQLLAITYLIWNAWHFGSQHFGVASLMGWKRGPRWLRRWGIIGVTMASMLLPWGSGLVPLLVAEIMSFAHWTTDIGLSTWRARRPWWVFLLVVLVVGSGGFLWKIATDDPRLCGAKLVCTAVYSIPALLGLRYGLGFVHFLYSRWVWQLSNPLARR
jgi:hypothetical protein